MKNGKGLIMTLICLAFFCACAEEEQPGSLSLTADEQTAYTNIIDTVTDEFYWSYDGDSLVFHNTIVPENNEANAALFAASASAGYDLAGKAGEQAILATAELLHYNGDPAGQAEFIFTDRQLAGMYYTGGYNNGIYSLLIRNPFIADTDFNSYENWSGTAEGYAPTAGGTLPDEGFVSKSSDGEYVISIINSQAQLYRFSGNGISLYATLRSGNMQAVNAVFFNDGEESCIAVLYNSLADATACAVVIYGEDLSQKDEFTPAEMDYTAIGAEDDSLFLFGDNKMDTYQRNDEGSWEKAGGQWLGHQVSQCHIADIDGNGSLEYILSDNMDLYLYHRLSSGMRRLWSTHLGVESLYGSIYTGDLNHDGIKEIYVSDTTGTAIRYILTENGLLSSNEDIEYGQAIYPCDWNNDGTDDYWFIADSESGGGALYLSQQKEENEK